MLERWSNSDLKANILNDAYEEVRPDIFSVPALMCSHSTCTHTRMTTEPRQTHKDQVWNATTDKGNKTAFEVEFFFGVGLQLYSDAWLLQCFPEFEAILHD